MPKGNVAQEQEVILVERAGQWGPQVNGEYYSVNAPLTPDMFQQGNTYTVLIRRGKPTEKYPKGKKYITQIVGEVAKQVTPISEGTAQSQTFNPSVDKAGSKDSAYWEKKDDAMRLGGLSHDAAAIVGALITSQGLDEAAALASFKRVFARLVEIREKQK